jgi:hypothetical protein
MHLAKQFFFLFRWHGTNLAENEQVITEERQQKGLNLLRHCPVSGAKLSDTDVLGNYVYMLVQMDAGVGKNLQGGTFRTASQVCPAPTCSACLYGWYHCCWAVNNNDLQTIIEAHLLTS